MDVAGTDALVDVLRGVVAAQQADGARMAVLTAHAVKQGAAALVEGGGYRTVAHRQRDLLLFEMFGFVGVEKIGFGGEKVRQRAVGGGHIVLHRPVGKDDVGQQRAQAVEQSSTQNQQRRLVPRRGVIVGERGIHRHRQRAESDGAVALAGRAEKGKNKRLHGHHRGIGRRPADHRFHRQRRHGKGQQGIDDVFQLAGQAVVQIHQAAGNHAQHQRRKQVVQRAGIHQRGQQRSAQQHRHGADVSGWQGKEFHKSFRAAGFQAA